MSETILVTKKVKPRGGRLKNVITDSLRVSPSGLFFSLVVSDFPKPPPRQ